MNEAYIHGADAPITTSEVFSRRYQQISVIRPQNQLSLLEKDEDIWTIHWSIDSPINNEEKQLEIKQLSIHKEVLYEQLSSFIQDIDATGETIIRGGIHSEPKECHLTYPDLENHNVRNAAILDIASARHLFSTLFTPETEVIA